MNQPILNIQMTPAGVELVVGALRKLPHEQVDGLVREIWAQYQVQMQPPAEPAPAPAEKPARGRKAKAKAEPTPVPPAAVPVEGGPA